MKPNPQRGAVSQSAIAREAGVARTTVSLALRGGEGLTAETINRVMDAAALLGYRPNNLVHAIRSGRTRIIGVMVPPYRSFWSDILHGIHDGLSEQNYVPLALWSKHRTTQNDLAADLRQVERLADWRVDGAILWPRFASLYQLEAADLKRRNLPVVTIDTTLPTTFHADAVLSDEKLGAEAVAEHLLSLGHREIIHFCGPDSETWSRDRRAYFETAVRRTSGVKLHVVTVPSIGPRNNLIREALVGLSGVTALYCATDEIAEESYQVAAELGLKIPEDISIVGYGNLDFGSRLMPPLTTVRHQPYRMGLAAARMVVARIEAADVAEPHFERLPVEFVQRSSTGPAPR